MFRTVRLFILCLLLCVSARRGSITGQQYAGCVRKQAQATRVDAGSISWMAALTRSCGDGAEPITDFVQAEPSEGAQTTDPMEIRFVYDETRPVDRRADA